MVDPTWTRTCPCGAKVSVNQLGQHHHTDCEYNPLSPGCCDDSQVRRRFFWRGDAGTRCENCGEEWPGTPLAVREAIAADLVDGFDVGVGPRNEIMESNLRVLKGEY